MRDLDKARALLATAPACERLIQQVLARDSRLTEAEFAALNANWHAAHGPCPGDTPTATFGWNVREENTLRWCLARLHVLIAAQPAHGLGVDHVLPLGRELLEASVQKHRIGED